MRMGSIFFSDQLGEKAARLIEASKRGTTGAPTKYDKLEKLYAQLEDLELTLEETKRDIAALEDELWHGSGGAWLRVG